MIELLLKNNNLKITKPRLEVLNIINKLNDNATIKNIINNCNTIDKSTIYRIIELLIEKNIIEKKINYNDEIYYIIKENHSHYITCVKCHKKEKINICPITILDNDLKDYKILNHNIEIMGICKECR